MTDRQGFTNHGAVHRPGLIDAAMVDSLRVALAPVPLERPGLRLHGVPAIDELLGPQGAMGRWAADLMGYGAMPVRAVLFDKSQGRNWAVGWHQDRVIAVRERQDMPGFGPWSVKEGVHHVAPPIAVLQRMVTIRLHLDPVTPDNAPLLYAPGSHLLGLVPDHQVAQAVAGCGVEMSLAGSGDAWAYSTLILHASDRAIVPRRRRVLHVDYAADMLPGGLAWLGV